MVEVFNQSFYSNNNELNIQHKYGSYYHYIFFIMPSPSSKAILAAGVADKLLLLLRLTDDLAVGAAAEADRGHHDVFRSGAFYFIPARDNSS